MALSICLVAMALALGPAPSAQGTLEDAVTEGLRARLEIGAQRSSSLAAAGQPRNASETLLRFYENRSYRPAWLDAEGAFETTRALIRAIEDADRHGLDAADYRLVALRKLLFRALSTLSRRSRVAELFVDLDLAATDAFLVYGAHLVAGRVDPVSLGADWEASPFEADLALLLEETIASGRIGDGLAALLPVSPRYRELQDGLERYRELAARGGWRALAEGPKMEAGASGEPVRRLRQRLAVSGDLVLAGDQESTVFDDVLDRAVRGFQRRHGLEVDGAVGPKTLAALNVPVAERVAQIALNLERWRWLPRDLGRRHIVVNIPAFELNAIENDETVLAMRAVVGRPYRRTPIFSAKLQYLVVSPAWHVPPSLAARDILPAVQKDLLYLAERGFTVLTGWGEEARAVDPASIDWKSLSAKDLPYRFRQEPGDRNALGRIKFMFPNWHNVYLHDTPQQELFLPARRDFSSGCIRIERPFDLAEHVLRGDQRWTREALLAAAAVDAQTTIPLRDLIPVHLVYWTSWPEGGEIHFRDDINGRDPGLAAALDERRP